MLQEANANWAAAMRAKNIDAGVVAGEHRLLVCVTELTATADIDTLAAALATTFQEN